MQVPKTSSVVICSLLFLILFCVSGLNDFNNNNRIDDDFVGHSLELTQSVNLARQEHIQEVCNRIPFNYSLDDLPKNRLEHILIDDKYKLLYCYVPKVACTNWKRILMILQGKWNNTDVLAIPGHLAHTLGLFRNMSSVNKQERDYIIENYHKMIIVRNPFERLLSAYRNKLEVNSPNPTYFQNHWGRKIIKAYRDNPSQESLKLGNDVTFKEFVLFLTDPKQELADIAVNEHWDLITNLCHPCAVKYNLVGKYETIHEDAKLALHTINASDAVQFPYRNSETANLLYDYYSQLPLPLIRKLYKMYKQDYAIFDYHLDNIVGFDLG